jgi:hypothetical protein
MFLKHRLLGNLVYLVLLCAASVTGYAQTQVFIGAKTGLDGGNCTVNNPCRNVNYALTQVAAGGEINIIESGDYASASLTKSVTVQATPGIIASFSTNVGACIAINAAATDVVSLRNLFLNGQGLAARGVSGNTAAAIQIDRLTVTRFTAQGIIFNNVNSKNSVTNTIVTNCNVGIGVGLINSGLNTIKAVIENCQVENCQFGYSLSAQYALNQVRVTIRDSAATHCTASGFNHAGGSGTVTSMLEGILAMNNNTALLAGTNTTVFVSNSTIVQNDTGLNTAGGGSILTRRNNTVESNAIPGAFTGVYSAK